MFFFEGDNVVLNEAKLSKEIPGSFFKDVTLVGLGIGARPFERKTQILVEYIGGYENPVRVCNSD